MGDKESIDYKWQEVEDPDPLNGLMWDRWEHPSGSIIRINSPQVDDGSRMVLRVEDEHVLMGNFTSSGDITISGLHTQIHEVYVGAKFTGTGSGRIISYEFSDCLLLRQVTIGSVLAWCGFIVDKSGYVTPFIPRPGETPDGMPVPVTQQLPTSRPRSSQQHGLGEYNPEELPQFTRQDEYFVMSMGDTELLVVKQEQFGLVLVGISGERMARIEYTDSFGAASDFATWITKREQSPRTIEFLYDSLSGIGEYFVSDAMLDMDSPPGW